MTRLLPLCLTACIVAPDDTTARDNVAPHAALRAPVIAPVGVPVLLDAGRSFDPDADPLTYVFEIGTAPAVSTSARTLEHTFSTPGLFTVRVRVIDIHGASASAAHDVTVRTEFPEEPFCVVAADCSVGDECDGGRCYWTGEALE